MWSAKLFCLVLATSAAVASGFFRKDDTISLEEYKKMLPAMIRGADRIAAVDPFYLLRGKHDDRETTLKRGKPDKIFDLTLPEGTVEERHLEVARRLLDGDEDSVLREVIAAMDENKELNEEDLPLFVLKYIIAVLTPILHVSDTCFRQSVAYIDHLFHFQEEVIPKMWALKMLDSTGKVPDGILADMQTFCDILHFWSADECHTGPQEDQDFLQWFSEAFPIPNGNTVAYGSFHGCLKVEATRGVLESHDWEPFQGKHCGWGLYGGAAKSSPLVGNRGHFDLYPSMPNISRNGLMERMPIIPPWLDGSWPEIMDGFLSTYISTMHPVWGQCIPSGCTEEDAYVNYQNLFSDYPVSLVQYFCEDQKSQEEIHDFDAFSYVVIGIFSFLAFLMLLGTLIDVYQQFFPPKYTVLAGSTKHEEMFVLRALKCFSVNINGRKVLNTDNVGGADHLGCLSGIRTMSMLWVLLGHLYMYADFVPLVNPARATNMMLGRLGWTYEILVNGLPSVDTFFFLSGLLVAYLSFLDMDKKPWNVVKWVMFYVHRYIRLTIPLALVILFAAGISAHIGEGPNWKNFLYLYEEGCRDYGWTNILYLNNFIEPEVCLGQTWYLACDWQMFIVSPLVFYPMFHTTKYFDGMKKYIGLAWFGIVLFIFTLLPIILVAVYDLPLTTIFLTDQVDPKEFDFNLDFYIMPWTRCQPYLVGIFVGYILWQTKGKKIDIPWYVNVACWIASVLIGFAVVVGLYGAREANTFSAEVYHPPMVASIFYNGFYKIAWGVAIGWVVFACVKGHGGLINTFLSWGLFVVPARLTYMAYLVHMGIIAMFVASVTYALDYNDWILSYYFIGLAMVTFGVSFVATLIVEAPFISLEKLVFGKLLGSATRAPPQKEQQAETKAEFVAANAAAEAIEDAGDLPNKEQPVNGEPLTEKPRIIVAAEVVNGDAGPAPPYAEEDEKKVTQL